MTPRTRARDRLNVVLQMVTTLIVAILLGQLWLFTAALDAMETSTVSSLSITVAVCSLGACVVVWTLIRFFLRTEREEVKE
jgi:hypothetical protein